MSSHVLIQDPNSLSSRFSNEDKIGFDDINEIDREINEAIEDNLQASEESSEKLDFASIEKYLARIPVREADLITMYHSHKMKQEQIAKIFSITQAAVSYRLARGIKRIQFLRTIPELEYEEFETDLSPHFNEQDREILWNMYLTTCQSKIAKSMNLTQGHVRHRFFRSLTKLKELIALEVRDKQMFVQMLKKQNHPQKDIDEAEGEVDNAINSSAFSKYWTVFFSISDKRFNILHEVSLPQFKDRSITQILPID